MYKFLEIKKKILTNTLNTGETSLYGLIQFTISDLVRNLSFQMYSIFRIAICSLALVRYK